MKKILAFLLLFPTFVSADSIVGMWEYPNRSVWIEVSKDELVFQCRIDIDGTPIKSTGILDGAVISWSQIWGNDFVTIENDILFLEGQHGKFGFIRSNGEMAEVCNNPF